MTTHITIVPTMEEAVKKMKVMVNECGHLDFFIGPAESGGRRAFAINTTAAIDWNTCRSLQRLVDDADDDGEHHDLEGRAMLNRYFRHMEDMRQNPKYLSRPPHDRWRYAYGLFLDNERMRGDES